MSTTAKQTAVEWLERRFHFTKGQLIDIDFEKAKEMEKEQIVKAWEYGCMTNYGNAQTYYNEIYKGEK